MDLTCSGRWSTVASKTGERTAASWTAAPLWARWLDPGLDDDGGGGDDDGDQTGQRRLHWRRATLRPAGGDGGARTWGRRYGGGCPGWHTACDPTRPRGPDHRYRRHLRWSRRRYRRRRRHPAYPAWIATGPLPWRQRRRRSRHPNRQHRPLSVRDLLPSRPPWCLPSPPPSYTCPSTCVRASFDRADDDVLR